MDETIAGEVKPVQVSISQVRSRSGHHRIGHYCLRSPETKTNAVYTGEVIRLMHVDISIKYSGLRYFSSS